MYNVGDYFKYKDAPLWFIIRSIIRPSNLKGEGGEYDCIGIEPSRVDFIGETWQFSDNWLKTVCVYEGNKDMKRQSHLPSWL